MPNPSRSRLGSRTLVPTSSSHTTGWGSPPKSPDVPSERREAFRTKPLSYGLGSREVLRRPRGVASPTAQTSASAAPATQIGCADGQNCRQCCAGRADWHLRRLKWSQALRRPRRLASPMAHTAASIAQAARIGFAYGPSHADWLRRWPKRSQALRRPRALPSPMS